MTSNQPRILVWDIENSPIEAYVWEHWDANVLHTIEDSYLLCVAFNWLGTGTETQWFRKAQGKANDKALVKHIWELLDQADYVIAHNGDNFDQKKANTRFLKYGMPPPSPYVQIDTLKEAKRNFALASNALNEIVRFLDLGMKPPHEGIELWMGCMDEVPSAWETMEKYNVHDVKLLAEVFDTLAPWIGQPGRAGPQANAQQWGTHRCTKLTCGSPLVVARGQRRTKSGVYQTYQCKTCGGYSQAKLRDDGKWK